MLKHFRPLYWNRNTERWARDNLEAYHLFHHWKKCSRLYPIFWACEHQNILLVSVLSHFPAQRNSPRIQNKNWYYCCTPNLVNWDPSVWFVRSYFLKIFQGSLRCLSTIQLSLWIVLWAITDEVEQVHCKNQLFYFCQDGWNSWLG